MLSAAKTEAGEERGGKQREQHEAPRVLPPIGRSGHFAEHQGDTDGDEDPDGKRPCLAQDEFPQRPHHAAASVDAGRPPRALASARTAPCDSASQTSRTRYLSSVPGSRRSGRCSTNPRPSTSTTAAAPPASAGSSQPGRAASTVTMRITSTPSSSTPLKAITKPGQSNPSPGGASSAR